MVRLLVEEARDALPLPNHPQRERDVRFVISTSPHAPIPRSGFVHRPKLAGGTAPQARTRFAGGVVPRRTCSTTVELTSRPNVHVCPPCFSH